MFMFRLSLKKQSLPLSLLPGNQLSKEIVMKNKPLVNLVHFRPGAIVEFRTGYQSDTDTSNYVGVISHLVRNGGHSYLAVFSHWWMSDKPEEVFTVDTGCLSDMQKAVNVVWAVKLLQPAHQNATVIVGPRYKFAEMEEHRKKLDRVISNGWVKIKRNQVIFEMGVGQHDYLAVYLDKGKYSVGEFESLDFENLRIALFDQGTIVRHRKNGAGGFVNQDSWVLNKKRLKRFLASQLNKFKINGRAVQKADDEFYARMYEEDMDREYRKEYGDAKDNITASEARSCYAPDETYDDFFVSPVTLDEDNRPSASDHIS